MDNPEISKYRSGYSDCIREVARYLATPEPIPSATVPSLNDSGSKSRLLRHLDACLLEIDSEMTTSKDPSILSRDCLRTPSTVQTECSQDSINQLDFTKINHERVLNLTKSSASLSHVSVVTAPSSSDENNNGQNVLENVRRTSSPVISTSPLLTSPLSNDNYSQLFVISNRHSDASEKNSSSIEEGFNIAVMSSKREKSFMEKNDKSAQAFIPPKKAMILSVEKELILVKKNIHFKRFTYNICISILDP